MKLTAPPPPPPEPPEQSGSGQSNPNEPTPANTPAVETATPQPAPKAVEKTVTWPAWFAGADFLLAALTLTLAFLVSSFIARNPDIWLHLAAGKRLLAGEYQPGTDPFSYSAADRAWVNHSLLFDLGAYLLYRGEGVLLVVVKALAVVLSFALLIAIRRKGFALWPWAVVAGIAILAAAPRMQVSPLVGSVFLLSVTLFLLFRLSHQPGSWRFPVAIGITFWIWAQVDEWFFLGPFALALVLVGELVQSRFRKSEYTANGTADADPLGTLPDIPTLAKALGIGVLACMLNPHHIRIWELPFELIGAKGVGEDNRFRSLLLSPLDKLYVNNSLFGYSWNGLAYAVLFVGGGVVLGLGVGRIRFAHIALWLGFALLTLASIFAIPFFAVVAVPLVASQLNALSTRSILKSWGDPKTKFLLLGSAGGRVVVLILLLAACVVSWPGWMQPEGFNPAFNRRVAWGIEPDHGLVRAAQQLQSWRESGRLPSEIHGAITSIELANYCAWFAPLEKVYINGNYNHHRKELSEFIEIRGDLGLFPRSEEPDTRRVGPLLEKIGAKYLAIAATQGDTPSVRTRSVLHSLALWSDVVHWSPLYLDGRTEIGAWNSTPETKQAALTALQLDPVVLAFGPNVEKLPVGSVKPIPPVVGWEGEFLHGIGLSPPEADEPIAWNFYKDLIGSRYKHLEAISAGLWNSFLPVPTPLTFHLLTMTSATSSLGNRFRRPPEELSAIPFLSLRAARRAIAADPDNPDGYYALYQALGNSELPLAEGERVIEQVNALRQCLMRLPPPEQFRPNIYRASPFDVARNLAMLYLGGSRRIGLPLDLPGFQILLESPSVDGVLGLGEVMIDNKVSYRPIPWRERNRIRMVGGPYLRAIDLAREMIVLASTYAEIEFASDSNKEAEPLKAELKRQTKAIEDEYVAKNKEYEREKLQGGQMKLPVQVKLALKYNLVGEALKILTEATDLPKEYGPSISEIVLVRIALELATGRLENAADDIGQAPRVLESAPMPPGVKREEFSQIQAIRSIQLHHLTYQKMIYEGNYPGAGEILESSMRILLDQEPSITTDEAAFKLSTPFVKIGPDLTMYTFQFIQVDPLTHIFGRDLLISRLLQPFIQRQQTLHTFRFQTGEFFFKRGLLSLIEGDIPNAKKRFEQSRRPGVPEWGVPDQRNQSAERYLKLIEEAEKRAWKP